MNELFINMYEFQLYKEEHEQVYSKHIAGNVLVKIK